MMNTHNNSFKHYSQWIKIITAILAMFGLFSTTVEAKKKILFIAGKPSHKNGEHEFRAGSMLLAKALNESGLDVEAKVHFYGWPKDESIFEGVDACIIYADAGGRFGEKYDVLDEHVKAGMGIMFMHYGVHPKKPIGEKYFSKWIGGYMETGWSVNPHWIADIFPRDGHPVSFGVKTPFTAYDEFYWNMRFPSQDECDCCHSLATATPTPDRIIRYINLWNKHGEETMNKPQALMWCRDPQPSEGGRGVGFVGGHYHHNWAIDDFRKLVLNAIVWLARGEVPSSGVPSKEITKEALNENLDRPVIGESLELPTAALLQQKPMKMPDLSKKKKRKSTGETSQSSILSQSTVVKASDKKRLQTLTADIKGLSQIELYVGSLGSANSDWANWISPIFKSSNGDNISVNETHIASHKQDHKKLAINLNYAGKPLKIEGREYSHGFGTHASSSVILNVPKGAVSFTVQVGIDDGAMIREGQVSPAEVQFFVRKLRDPQSDWEPGLQARNVDLEYFKVPEGLEVTRWAESPLLYNPTNIDIDQHGRIWAAEGVNYRRHKGRRSAGDRIVVIEDSDGDGVADQSHTFVQEKELIAPLGVAVFDNVIVVAQPPNIIVYTDVDRDLKFDPKKDKREILLTGFNAGNHDHSLHSMTAGPDGKWYFNNGNCGAVFTDKSGNTFRMGGNYYKSGGGDWHVDHRKQSGKKSDDGFVWTSGFSVRMNPDGTDAEIIGHGYRNSYEHATTSLGDLFQNDNDDPPACRVSYVLEYGSAGYFSRDGKRSWRQEVRSNQEHWRAHWRQDDPGTFDAGDIYGGGSPTGIVFYENGALGERWQGLLLSAEAGKNVIFGYQPKVKGATFQLDRNDFCTTNEDKQYQGSDFIMKNQREERHPNWKGKESPTLFRPSDVAVGPDGAIYISDWFDGRVGGHADKDDSCSGAIYRIAPKGFKPSIPKIDLNTTEGQITALASPAINVRYSGFKGLKASGEKSLGPLSELLKHPNKWVAARAIWLLPHLGEKGLKQCVDMLSDENFEIRLIAYRALQRAGVDVQPYAMKMAQDPSAAVRRDVALSMRGRSVQEMQDVLIAVAKGYDGKDKNYLESIGLGAENHESAIWLAMKKELGHEDPIQWSDNFVKLTWRLWPSAAVADLKARALSEKVSPEARVFAVESLSFIDHQSAADAMFSIFHSTKNSLVKDEATFWLLRRGIGSWKDMKLMPQLKKLGIYDPENTKIQAIQVPAPGKPKFTAADALALKGDPQKGEAKIMQCVMCHQVGDVGAAYGPALKGWGKTQTAEVIANSIINPSADIAHGFKGSTVQLKNGDTVHGLAINKADPIIIRSTGGITQLIPRSKVKKVSGFNRSLMLSADQLGLTAQDVADIVAYMQEW